MSLNHREKFKLKKKNKNRKSPKKENWKIFHIIYAYFKVIKSGMKIHSLQVNSLNKQREKKH